MLGLFKRVLDVGQTHRVRRRARIDSSPRSTIELCALLQRQGRLLAAREAAREGLIRFPYSLELRQILHATWKRSSSQVVKSLEGRIVTDDSAGDHLQLVAHYLEFGELDSAAEACQRMVERHGQNLEVVLVAAEVLLGRFHRDHVAEDGSLGLRCLLKAVEIDPKCVRAHWDLCNTYYYIGAVSKAVFHLYKVLDESPDHSEARELQKILDRLPLERLEEAELLRRVEESDEAKFRVESQRGQDPREPGVRGAICSHLEQVSLMAGVEKTALSHRGLDVVSERGSRKIFEANEVPDPLLSFATTFRRTASLSAKRMGIGAFEESEMCWSGGWILALAVGRSVLLVKGTGSQRIPIVRAEARNFLAGLTIAATEAVDD